MVCFRAKKGGDGKGSRVRIIQESIRRENDILEWQFLVRGGPPSHINNCSSGCRKKAWGGGEMC